MRYTKNIWTMKILMLLMIIMVAASTVNALGIAPSRKVIDYDTESHTYTARIMNNELKDMKVLLYAQGELGEYVTLPQSTYYIKSIEPEKEFSYTIKLPSGLSPGTKNLSIVIIEVPLNLDVPENSQTMIISTVSVTHQLRVNVPYPGKFAEGTLYISEANVDETVTFTANIVSRGTDAIANVNGELVIKGPTNEEIARIKSNIVDRIASQQSEKLVANWLASVNPGVYYAEFIINYDDKQFVLRKTFIVGNFLLDIQNIKVNNFRLGGIAKFDVELLSKWNQPIQNVYGELQIMDTQGNVLSSFKTLPIELRQLTTSTISGYWDTKDVKIGNYDVKVSVYYDAKTSEKLFKTVVGIDSIQVQDIGALGNVVASKGSGGSIPLLYILVFISIILNIGLFIYFKFLRKKGQV